MLIEEYVFAKRVQQKDIKATQGAGHAGNLANKAGKDISATGNCTSKGIKSGKGVTDSRNCSISEDRNVGCQGRCVRK